MKGIGKRLKDGMASIVIKSTEKLKNRFGANDPESWHNYVIGILYFAFTFISYLHFKNIYLLLIIGLCVHLANVLSLAVDQRRGDGFARDTVNLLLLYPYLIAPCFSLIYLARLEKSNDIFLWILLTITSIKISIYLFENIYGGSVLMKKLHPTRTVLSFLGTLVVGTFIGLVSSLFLKQKFGHFTVINLTMVLLIHLQDLLGYQIKNHYLNQKDNLIICGYNNLTLITIFISCMIALGIIRV